MAVLDRIGRSLPVLIVLDNKLPLRMASDYTDRHVMIKQRKPAAVACACMHTYICVYISIMQNYLMSLPETCQKTNFGRKARHITETPPQQEKQVKCEPRSVIRGEG